MQSDQPRAVPQPQDHLPVPGLWAACLRGPVNIIFTCRSRTSSNQHRAMQCRNIVPEIPEQYEEMKPLVYWTKTKCNAIHDDVNVQQYNSCRTEIYCEDQGKGRAKGRLSTQIRKVTQRSFIDGGWWMVDILSLMLYTKFGCHHPLSFHRKSLNLQD